MVIISLSSFHQKHWFDWFCSIEIPLFHEQPLFHFKLSRPYSKRFAQSAGPAKEAKRPSTKNNKQQQKSVKTNIPKWSPGDPKILQKSSSEALKWRPRRQDTDLLFFEADMVPNAPRKGSHFGVIFRYFLTRFFMFFSMVLRSLPSSI